jgi:hypothetical protein
MKRDTQYNETQHNYIITDCCYAECHKQHHSAKCCYAECRYAEWHGALEPSHGPT